MKVGEGGGPPHRRRRILQVVPTYYPAVRYGGPIRSVHGLASSLAQRGHDVHVFTTNLDGPANLNVPVDRPVDIDGVSVHYFPVPALRRLAWSPAMQRNLDDKVAGFDVLHLHSVFLWPLQAAARAAVRAGVPYLIAPRGMLVRDIIHRKSRWAKTAWIELIEKRTLAEAAGLHVTAELEIADVRALALPFRNAYCVQNGVDFPAEVAPLSQGPFAGIPRPYALFLSRLSWKKGLDRLIKAWKLVPDLPLVIGGNDYEGLIPSLTELARREGVFERIHFLGAVADEHKWALYTEARMLILPSYSENFGNVVAEAMAMRCPVIVTPEVGIAELVRTSDAGVVTDGDPPVLAQAIVRLASNPDESRAMGARGRAAVESTLSWRAIAARMEAVYEEVIAANRVPFAKARAS